MSYTISLLVHSWLRWALLASAVGVLVLAIRGVRQRRAWTPAQTRLMAAFGGLADLQLLAGLVLLLWTSPFATLAWRLGPSASMHTPALLVFGFLHPLVMITAFMVLKVGRARLRAAVEDAARQRIALRTTLAWLVLVVLAIPWPPLAWGRPLVP